MIIHGVPPVTEESPVTLNIANNPVFNKDILKTTDISTISDDRLYEIIKESYSNILQDLFNNVGDIYKKHFQNDRFLNTFIRVMQSCKSFTPEQRTYCNHLAYDYLTLPGATKYMKELFLTLSKTVNRDIIPALLGIGLEEPLATKIALARYSSFDEGINIQRLNVVLMNALNPDTTESSDIIKIYGKLFDHLSVLFNTVMFSTIQIPEDSTELSQEDIDAIEIDGLFGLAVLDILVTQPIDIISQVLKNYATEFAMKHASNPNAVRFSMKHMASDYDRLTYVIENVLGDEYYIP